MKSRKRNFCVLEYPLPKNEKETYEEKRTFVRSEEISRANELTFVRSLVETLLQDLAGET